MATAANFVSTPRFEIGNLVTANTLFDGTGTLATLFTAGASGSLVNSIELTTRATQATAVAIRFFISTDGGTTKKFWREKLFTVVTIANTTAHDPIKVIDKESPDAALRLPANAILYGCPATTANISAIIEGGNF